MRCFHLTPLSLTNEHTHKQTHTQTNTTISSLKSNNHTHTHTQTHTLFLTHTHTHTHIFLSLSKITFSPSFTLLSMHGTRQSNPSDSIFNVFYFTSEFHFSLQTMPQPHHDFQAYFRSHWSARGSTVGLVILIVQLSKYLRDQIFLFGLREQTGEGRC